MSYAERSDLDELYGSINVDKWADPDNQKETVLITARVVRALAYADAIIDDSLRGGLYALPVVDKSSATPVIINDMAAHIAAVWLYELRGTQDYDAKTGVARHKLMHKKQMVMDTLRGLRAGTMILDAELVGSILPSVVTDLE